MIVIHRRGVFGVVGKGGRVDGNVPRFGVYDQVVVCLVWDTIQEGHVVAIEGVDCARGVD